jgi:excisionase family DNA binding protein
MGGLVVVKQYSPVRRQRGFVFARKLSLARFYLAELLGGLSPRTVTRWTREGHIPAYPIGEGKRRLWRFRAEEVEQWLLSRSQGVFADRPPEEQTHVILFSATGASKGRK